MTAPVFYRFGDGAPTAVQATPDAVGHKAHGLIRLAAAGLPVPPGFVIGTDVCRRFFADGGRLPEGFAKVLGEGIAGLEQATGAQFGSGRHPLLVSVRSGAAVSMPGMMQTVLNVGFTPVTLRGLIRSSGNPRFVWDSYRRFLQSYAETVLDLPGDPFDQALAQALAHEGAPSEHELDAAALRDLCDVYRELIAAHGDAAVPDDAPEQLGRAVQAVLRSWESAPARTFRRLRDIDSRGGTAVTVQAMVFGNLGGASGSGVAFTRDPATGENRLYLDFLANAQGEDVVSGRRTAHGADDLRRLFPATYRELEQAREQLERLFGDVQDFEFTVQEGRLFLLQTRAAQRAPLAALRIAVELVDSGIISAEAALDRLAPYDIHSIQVRRLVGEDPAAALARGISAGQGVAVGRVALDSEAAERFARGDEPVILVRPDASTDDLGGMAAAEGILTAAGARTSHAAVVARQLDKVCIVGCNGLTFDRDRRRIWLGARPIDEGEFLSLDGNSGRVFAGRLSVICERPDALVSAVEGWQRLRAQSLARSSRSGVSSPREDFSPRRHGGTEKTRQ